MAEYKAKDIKLIQEGEKSWSYAKKTAAENTVVQ